MKTSQIIFILAVIFTYCESNNPAIEGREVKTPSYKGVTWARFQLDINDSLKLDSIIVSYEDIIGYDSVKHTYLLSDSAVERIRDQFPYRIGGFMVSVDSVPIFRASFIPSYSSSPYPNIICVDPFGYLNRYRFNLGYPSSKYFEGEDLRNDPRIIERFATDNKLIEIE